MRLGRLYDFDGLSPDAAYAFIFDALDPAESPIAFSKDVNPQLIESISLYRDVVAFLHLLRIEQPLKLTQKGNLPLFFCRKAVERDLVGPHGWWLKKHAFRGEMDCDHVHMMNALTRAAGLTRKTHGKLSLTKRGEGYLSGKKSLDLYRRLFFTYVRRLNWAYEDSYEEASTIQGCFGFSVYLVAKYGAEHKGVGFYADKFASAFPFIMKEFRHSPSRDPREAFNRCYSLRTFERFLQRFGLVDVKEGEGGKAQAESVVKSDLFDQLIVLKQSPALGRPCVSSSADRKVFDRVYQFKITLRETKPAVWRRIQVPETYTFWGLHVAIQDSMGWFDCHLHEFVIRDPKTAGEVFIGIPDDEFPSMRTTLACWQQKVSDWFSPERRTARYDYDFGDGWTHDVRLEKILPRDENVQYPVCVDGEMSCPPEDVGGTGGYEDFLRILSDPSNAEHARMLEWAGGEFNPTEFDPREVEFDDPQERLKALRDYS
jgi:hypothetical protein